jgi:hypothetical protein
MKDNFVLAIQYYYEDGWYGTRRRYFFKGENEEGFKTKSEAKKYVSLLKKFVEKDNKKGMFQATEIAVETKENFPTFKYYGAGPSWACCNCYVETKDFISFINEEKERLEKGRKEREFNKQRAAAYKLYKTIGSRK